MQTDELQEHIGLIRESAILALEIYFITIYLSRFMLTFVIYSCVTKEFFIILTNMYSVPWTLFCHQINITWQKLQQVQKKNNPHIIIIIQ